METRPRAGDIGDGAGPKYRFPPEMMPGAPAPLEATPAWRPATYEEPLEAGDAAAPPGGEP